MSHAQHHVPGIRDPFLLILVLFILLVIIGCSCGAFGDC